MNPDRFLTRYINGWSNRGKHAVMVRWKHCVERITRMVGVDGKTLPQV